MPETSNCLLENLMDDDRNELKTIQNTLLNTNKNLCPNISAIIFVLTMPGFTATTESSFSVMNRIKSYLVRTTITTDQLSVLVMVHIYRDVTTDDA